MYYNTVFELPIGNIMLACDEQENLLGLWLEGQKYFCATIDSEIEENNKLKIFLVIELLEQTGI